MTPATAIARLRERSPILIGAWFERLALIRLLSATGREREALAELDRGFPWPFASLTRGLWALEHARLADRLGENEKARERYGYVAKIWRHADPELQAHVAEAREALERLTREAGASSP